MVKALTKEIILSIFQHIEDCKKIMDVIDIEKADIVGHSIGGTIALQLASNYSDRIES